MNKRTSFLLRASQGTWTFPVYFGECWWSQMKLKTQCEIPTNLGFLPAPLGNDVGGGTVHPPDLRPSSKEATLTHVFPIYFGGWELLPAIKLAKGHSCY